MTHAISTVPSANSSISNAPRGAVRKNCSRALQQFAHEGQRGAAADVESLEAGRDRTRYDPDFVPLIQAPGNDMVFRQ